MKKSNSKYFASASAFVKERFAGADGFNNADGWGGYEAAGVNQRQYNSTSSMPYIVRAVNANGADTAVTIFNSYNNRTAANNGNLAGITVTSTMAGVTYNELLAQSEHKNFEAGMVYIEVIAGSNSGLTRGITLTTRDANGVAEVKPLTPKINPMQQQATVLEFYHTFRINGFTNWAVTLPANTTVEYTFYPSATVDPGRVLSNQPTTRDYVAPSISKPTQVVLSPRMLETLRK